VSESVDGIVIDDDRAKTIGVLLILSSIPILAITGTLAIAMIGPAAALSWGYYWGETR
jgi:hypothetical protein